MSTSQSKVRTGIPGFDSIISGGFRYSAMLTAATMVAIAMIQTHMISMSALVP